MKLLLAAVSAAMAVLLSGCGVAPKPPTLAPTVAPTASTTIEYIKVGGIKVADGIGSDQADVMAKLELVPDCNFQGLTAGPDGDMYKSVDMKCCKLATWTEAGIAVGEGAAGGVTYSAWDKAGKVGDTTEYSCHVGDLGDLNGYPTWVRGFQGCKGNQVTYAETCIPTGIDPTTQWPMTAEVAATHWEAGTYDSCHCTEPEQLGDVCFVGKTFPGLAFFGLSKGDAFCAAQLKTEVV